MKLRAKSVLPVVLAVCVLMSMGMKNDADESMSLRIVQHPGYPFPGEPLKTKETVVDIDGKTKENQRFLTSLWERNRPLFKKSDEVLIPVDSSWTEIFFNYGKEALTVGGTYSEHPQDEFGKGIKNILEESLKFQKEHASPSPSEVKQARMSQEQVIEVAKAFAVGRGKNLSEYQEPEARYVGELRNWRVRFTEHGSPHPENYFQVILDDKNGEAKEERFI